MTRAAACAAVELSALRQGELFPLLEGLKSLDLTGFDYISIHAPSQFEPTWEAVAWDRLREECWRNWPIVVHPDALCDFSIWREFGALLCVENMDKRKPIGRTARKLGWIFKQLPDADSDEGDHYSDLMAITIPSDADHRRSEATLSYSYHP